MRAGAFSRIASNIRCTVSGKVLVIPKIPVQGSFYSLYGVSGTCLGSPTSLFRSPRDEQKKLL